MNGRPKGTAPAARRLQERHRELLALERAHDPEGSRVVGIGIALEILERRIAAGEGGQ